MREISGRSLDLGHQSKSRKTKVLSLLRAITVLEPCFSWNQVAPTNDEETRNRIHTTRGGSSRQWPRVLALLFRTQVWLTKVRRIRFLELARTRLCGRTGSVSAYRGNSILRY